MAARAHPLHVTASSSPRPVTSIIACAASCGRDAAQAAMRPFKVPISAMPYRPVAGSITRPARNSVHEAGMARACRGMSHAAWRGAIGHCGPPRPRAGSDGAACLASRLGSRLANTDMSVLHLRQGMRNRSAVAERKLDRHPRWFVVGRRCRAAAAGTFVAGLGLARRGDLKAEQDGLWAPIKVWWWPTSFKAKSSRYWAEVRPAWWMDAGPRRSHPAVRSATRTRMPRTMA